MQQMATLRIGQSTVRDLLSLCTVVFCASSDIQQDHQERQSPVRTQFREVESLPDSRQPVAAPPDAGSRAARDYGTLSEPYSARHILIQAYTPASL